MIFNRITAFRFLAMPVRRLFPCYCMMLGFGWDPNLEFRIRFKRGGNGIFEAYNY